MQTDTNGGRKGTRKGGDLDVAIGQQWHITLVEGLVVLSQNASWTQGLMQLLTIPLRSSWEGRDHEVLVYSYLFGAKHGG